MSANTAKPTILRRKNRILIGFLILIAQIFVLAVIGWFVWNKIWFKGNLAAYLPEKNTVALAEINLNSDFDQLQKLRELLANSPAFNFQQLDYYLSDLIPQYVNFKPFLKSRIGIAFIHDHSTRALEPVLFIQSKNPQEDLNALFQAQNSTQIAAENLYGYSLYQTTQNYSVLLVDDYLVFSPKLSTIEQIALTSSGRINSLKNSQLYQRVVSSLPENNLASAYLNTEKFLESVLDQRALLPIRLSALQSYLPFLKILSAEGFTARIDQSNLIIQQISLVDSAYLEGQPFLIFQQSFAANLIETFQQDFDFIYTGRGLYSEYARLKSIYQNKSTIEGLVFEGQIQQIKNKFFSSSSGFENLILPLFDQQYLLATDQNLERFVFAIELKDAANNFYDLDKAIENNRENFAQLKPFKESFELPDGSTGERLISSSDNVKIYTENAQLKTIRIGAADDQNPLVFQYGLLDQYFVFASSKLLFEQMQQNLTKEAKNIYQNLTFSGKISQVDHYLQLNLPKISTYFSGISKLKYGRKYLDQGIISIVEIGF